LLIGGPDGSVLGYGVLEFDQGERETVDEEHHVRPADVVILGDGELADGEPVVVFRIVEVQHAGLGAADGALFAPELDRYAVHEHPVEGAVARFKGWSFGAGDLAEGVLEGLCGESGVEQGKGLAETSLQNYLLVGLPFGIYTVGAEVAAMPDHPSEAL
jgi:hypothetical protein